MSRSDWSRRDFVRTVLGGSVAGGLVGGAEASAVDDVEALLARLREAPPATAESVIGLRTEPLAQVRVGVIGLGNRGKGLCRLVRALEPDKSHLTAICDIRAERVELTLQAIEEGDEEPAVYGRDESSWRELIARDDIDLVIIATQWELHAPMAIAAMRAGKHVAIEVPAALTVDECWALVNTSEETRRHCIMLENVCYGDEELWVLSMAEQGVFGTLTYAEAGYIHDLRERWLFGPDGYHNMWRIRHHVARDANLYPTHGLGPVAQYMDINRGDKFDYLVSMSSPQAALSEFSRRVEPSNEFYNRDDFKHGDMNTALIKTRHGRTILLKHDVVTPRPYSRINALAGTRAYHEGYPSRLAVDGHHGWLDEQRYGEYRDKYRHPLWYRLKAGIETYGGHGGMDFVMMYRLIDGLNQGRPLDMDVYDAASWSVVTELTEHSVRLNGRPVEFPDFTRGRWSEERALGVFQLA